MHSLPLLLAATATLLPTISAHGFVTGVTIKGTFTGTFRTSSPIQSNSASANSLTNGSDPIWFYFPSATRPQTAGWDALNQDIGFVEPAAAGTADVNCHKSATSSSLYAAANAGDTVEFKWSGWPEGHNGPIINYIAPCNGDCTKLASSSLRWSKISQAAIVSPGVWVTDTLIKNKFRSSTVLPAKLAPGNYVIRHEIIALHAAGSDNGAQFYPQCLNLKIGGSGKVAATGGVAGTTLYKRDDAGIKFNLYTNPTTYPFPGPALWTAAN